MSYSWQVPLGLIFVIGMLLFLALFRCIGLFFPSLEIGQSNTPGTASDRNTSPGPVGVMHRANNNYAVEESAVTRGIGQTMLEACPKIIYSEKLLDFRTPVSEERHEQIMCSCAICLHDYQDSVDVLRQLPVCGHVFHAACIDQWLALQATCPICRYSLES